MKEVIQLQVPEPCHQNWNKMTETDKGRFCLSCQKEVIDFSLMSDKQILEYISSSNKKICGRFAEPQLNRDLISKKEIKLPWIKYFMHVIIPALLISHKSSAQEIKIGDSIVCQPRNLVDKGILIGKVGGLAVGNGDKHKSKIIRGKVTDENAGPLAGVVISIKGTNNRTETDNEGFFKLITKEKHTTLIASSVGYERKEVLINATGSENENLIMISLNRQTLGEVIVVGYSIVRKKNIVIDTLEPVKNFINGFINKDSIKIYPNPVQRGSEFKIEFNNQDKGAYTIEVLNASGQMIMQKAIQLNSKKIIEEIACNSAMMQGIYFVNVINKKTMKSFTKQVLVQ